MLLRARREPYGPCSGTRTPVGSESAVESSSVSAGSDTGLAVSGPLSVGSDTGLGPLSAGSGTGLESNSGTVLACTVSTPIGGLVLAGSGVWDNGSGTRGWEDGGVWEEGSLFKRFIIMILFALR